MNGKRWFESWDVRRGCGEVIFARRIGFFDEILNSNIMYAVKKNAFQIINSDGNF